MNDISKGDRIINGFVDVFIIAILFFMVEIFLINVYYPRGVVFYVIMFLYYFILESTTSQTLGKKITGTIVVNMHNEKPSLKRIFLRTLLRLNPFDWYSYAFGNEQGGHDLISKTRLVRKQR